MLTYKEAVALFRYDTETGHLYWRKPGAKRNLSKPAGHQDKTGYRRVMVNYKMYLAHRIIWLLAYGKWPDGILDHIDRDPTNNRLSNLRESNHSANGINAPAKRTSKTGVRGVDIDPRTGNYTLRLRGRYLGTFSTIAAATKAAEKFNANTD